MTRGQLRVAARRILRKGLAAVEPGRLVRAHIRVEGDGVRVAGVRIKATHRVFVVSVGKAAAPMARAAHAILGRRITAGILIAPRRSGSGSKSGSRPLPRTKTFVAGHPIPDAAGLLAGRQVMRLLEPLAASDVVLLLLSGGASSLMPAPIDGVSLADKQRVTRLLLSHGASIAETNAVRKRLSRLKGGGFARLAAPARVITLALSDVPGDDIRTIGSGPTVDDPGVATRARRSLLRLLSAGEIPEAVRSAIARPKTAAPRIKGHKAIVIGSGRVFARAAAREARALGLRTVCLPDGLRGEARVCGPALVRRFVAWRGRQPGCLLVTGETVVTVVGAGFGGRNQEVALSAVPALARLGRPAVMATCATDGVDGRSEASGGLVDDRTERRARLKGFSIPKALGRNDSTAALRRLGGLLATGPTGTNVADITVILG